MPDPFQRPQLVQNPTGFTMPSDMSGFPNERLNQLGGSMYYNDVPLEFINKMPISEQDAGYLHSLWKYLQMMEMKEKMRLRY